MEKSDRLLRLAHVLQHDMERIVAQWMAAIYRRSWTIRTWSQQDMALSGSAAIQESTGEECLALTWAAVLQERCTSFLSSLADVLTYSSGIALGAPELRETVQILSFTAGWLASAGATFTDAVALVHGLQETLRDQKGIDETFYHNLVIIVGEAYCAALFQKRQTHYREAMEKCQLVCLLQPKIPALFLVGEPDRTAITQTMGRLLQLAHMRDAAVVLADLSGLFTPTPVLDELLSEWATQRKPLDCLLLVSGLPPQLIDQHQSRDILDVVYYEDLACAMTEATRRVS